MASTEPPPADYTALADDLEHSLKTNNASNGEFSSVIHNSNNNNNNCYESVPVLSPSGDKIHYRRTHSSLDFKTSFPDAWTLLGEVVLVILVVIPVYCVFGVFVYAFSGVDWVKTLPDSIVPLIPATVLSALLMRMMYRCASASVHIGRVGYRVQHSVIPGCWSRKLAGPTSDISHAQALGSGLLLGFSNSKSIAFSLCLNPDDLSWLSAEINDFLAPPPKEGTIHAAEP